MLAYTLKYGVCNGFQKRDQFEMNRLWYLRDRIPMCRERAWKKKLAPWRNTTTPVQPNRKNSSIFFFSRWKGASEVGKTISNNLIIEQNPSLYSLFLRLFPGFPFSFSLLDVWRLAHFSSVSPLESYRGNPSGLRPHSMISIHLRLSFVPEIAKGSSASAPFLTPPTPQKGPTFLVNDLCQQWSPQDDQSCATFQFKSDQEPSASIEWD